MTNRRLASHWKEIKVICTDCIFPAGLDMYLAHLESYQIVQRTRLIIMQLSLRREVVILYSHLGDVRQKQMLQYRKGGHPAGQRPWMTDNTAVIEELQR